ncbi:MAG: hypothetical protein AAF628_19600 [Planctomycetota bacterium]
MLNQPHHTGEAQAHGRGTRSAAIRGPRQHHELHSGLPPERYTEQELSTAGFAGLGRVLADLARDERLLVLLDGLDEVPAERRSQTDNALLELHRARPRAPVVVASRRIGASPCLAVARSISRSSRWWSRTAATPAR